LTIQLFQEANRKINSNKLPTTVSIRKKKIATMVAITKTITVVVIVSLLEGQIILETSERTCCTYLNGFTIIPTPISTAFIFYHIRFGRG
jgi:hypothetical protein